MLELRPAITGSLTLTGGGETQLDLTRTKGSVPLTLFPFFQGPPGDTSSAFVFRQTVPATVWTINHNLGIFPNVYVIDTAGQECEGKVNHVNTNQVVITFSAAFAGQARLT